MRDDTLAILPQLLLGSALYRGSRRLREGSVRRLWRGVGATSLWIVGAMATRCSGSSGGRLPNPVVLSDSDLKGRPVV